MLQFCLKGDDKYRVISARWRSSGDQEIFTGERTEPTRQLPNFLKDVALSISFSNNEKCDNIWLIGRIFDVFFIYHVLATRIYILL
jgi:hypothetical protein